MRSQKAGDLLQEKEPEGKIQLLFKENSMRLVPIKPPARIFLGDLAARWKFRFPLICGGRNP